MTDATSAEQQQALLGSARQEEGWAAVPAAQRPSEGPSVAELLGSSPDTVIATLQSKGVQQVAEFCLPDKLVLGRLAEGGDSIATMGAESAELDYECAWRHELGPCRARRRPAAQQDHTTPDSACSRGVGGNEWCSDIPVLAYVVSVRDAAAPAKRGLLRPLIRRWRAGGCGTSTFRLPVAQAVIDWKWRFCRRLLIAELGLYLLWLASFFAFALAHRVQDDSLPMAQLLATRRGQLAVGADVAGLVAMSPFLYAEACTALAYRAAYFDLWRALDAATYCLQVLVCVLHLGRFPEATCIIPVAAAVQCVLLLFRLQFFTRIFPATRFAFVDDLKEVLRDVRWYLAFMALLMLGFATSFVVLFSPDAAAGRGHKEFEGVGRAFVTMVSWVAGDPNLTLLYSGVSHSTAACCLGLAYVFALTLVFTTLLISLMTNTLQQVTRDAEARQLLSKALVIDELESTIPGLLHRLWPEMHPRFLHVLRIDPSRLDAVKLDRLWKSLRDDDAQALQGPGPTPAVPAEPAALTAPTAPPRQHLQLPPLPPAHTRQHSEQQLSTTAGTSALGSVPGEAPPSWQGSLMDAYLGASPELGEGSPSPSDHEADLLRGQQWERWQHKLGQGPAGGAPSEPEAGGAVSTNAVANSLGELAALRAEVRELRQLMLAALAGLPQNGAGAASPP